MVSLLLNWARFIWQLVLGVCIVLRETYFISWSLRRFHISRYDYFCTQVILVYLHLSGISLRNWLLLVIGTIPSWRSNCELIQKPFRFFILYWLIVFLPIVVFVWIGSSIIIRDFDTDIRVIWVYLEERVLKMVFFYADLNFQHLLFGMWKLFLVVDHSLRWLH